MRAVDRRWGVRGGRAGGGMSLRDCAQRLLRRVRQQRERQRGRTARAAGNGCGVRRRPRRVAQRGRHPLHTAAPRRLHRPGRERPLTFRCRPSRETPTATAAPAPQVTSAPPAPAEENRVHRPPPSDSTGCHPLTAVESSGPTRRRAGHPATGSVAGRRRAGPSRLSGGSTRPPTARGTRHQWRANPGSPWSGKHRFENDVATRRWALSLCALRTSASPLQRWDATTLGCIRQRLRWAAWRSQCL